MRWCIPIVAAVSLWVSDDAYGQETTHGSSRKDLAVSGVLMLPQGDWIRPRLSIAGGGGFRALFPVTSSLVSAGVDAQMLFYGEGRRGNEQIMLVHALLRTQLGTDDRRAYLEAFGGFKGFSADAGDPGTYSYGAGVGMRIPIATRSPFGPDDEEFIEIGVRFLKGGGARLAPDEIARHTHSVMLYLGWGFHRRSARGRS